uniref:rhamnogalacturonan endolyase n=1 Tax=Brassica campestris TaxID=3711 RepID=M4D2D0_BRACM
MISQKTIASWMICFLLLLLLPIAFSEPTRNLKGTNARAPTVQQIRNKEVIVDNGIVRVTFSNPKGLITGIKYNEIGNVLNPHLRARGYWDITWQTENNSLPKLDRIEGTNFRIITQNEEQVEISFSRTWNGGSDHIPLNVDKRYIIRTNTSGIYTYGIFERQPEWPEVEMAQIRVAFKLNPDRFLYMVVADNRQRQMPTDDDRDINSGRAKPLAYKEAVQLTNPHNQMFKNQVDDKYQYSCEVKDNKVHGWISTNSNVGFWLISPSGEYRSGGPVKQELTSHVGPTTLTTFISQHYVGPDMETRYKTGEAWKKVLGPVFIYLNSDSTRNNLQHLLWEDAKRQTEQEVEAWPYGFVASSDFPTRQERGTITGRLFVNDRFLAPAGYAYIGLAPPGEAGSWQTNTKGYQFWTQTNETGYFTIDNVRPGTYNLYGWVHGFIGDFKYQNLVNVAAGSEISLDRVVFQPPRNGPTLWEIGVPDRTAREYFVPEPYENTMNPLYLNHTDKFRQYGLWQRYTELYPNHDLVYTVGVSNYSQDWFYAHVTRNIGGSTYVPATWQIVFELPYVNWRGSYTLQIALASAARANLKVRFNNEYSRPLLSAGVGRDNAIARHGIHGAYHLYSIDVPGRLLRTGTNTIYLRQSKAGYQFWTQTNETGYFTIDNVRPGTYNLYGWVHGFIGDFKYQNLVNVAAGSEISLDRVVFQPPRNGPTLWEIGVPDRTAREYFVPEPYENTMNPLYLNHTDKFRQYGLWQRYTELYPNHDLVYTVGVSNYSQDWFYAHVTRNIGGSTYVPATWQIVFELPYVNWRGSYTLQIALASAARANLKVRFNNEYSRPLLSAGVGRDNAIARHGIHGAYHLYSIDVPGRLLRTGTNTIYLRQSKAVGPFEGLMYDYIRLEEPSTA